jgi:hypothetical protein
MSATQPVLNEQEWSLVLELLMDEREELPAERRRTDSLDYLAQIDQRRKVVDGLIERLQTQGVHA